MDGWNKVAETYGSELGEYEFTEGSRALWPWALFSLALAASFVLFFVYPPR